jgi:hypothetical protein
MTISPFPSFFRTPPIPPSWFAHFDNSDWEIDTQGSWDAGNSEWDSQYWPPGIEILSITEIGSWASGYKPTKIRITFTGATDTAFSLKDISSNVICSKGSGIDLSYTSGEEIECDFGSGQGDIYRLEVQAGQGADFSVTNIEFLAWD